MVWAHGQMSPDETPSTDAAFRCPVCGGTEFQHQEFVLARRTMLGNSKELGLVFNGLIDKYEIECSRDECLWCLGCDLEIDLPIEGLELEYV